MRRSTSATTRQRLDDRLKGLRALVPATPDTSWVRAIREALGMSVADLAGRLGLAPSGVSRIERDELSGKVRLETLRRLAEALDCTLVYALVPNSSLEATVRAQAKKLATAQIGRVDQSMRLERQEVSPRELAEYIDELVDRYVSDPPPSLWRKP
jgi:predicted DNA-binding mobile mystery protein A